MRRRIIDRLVWLLMLLAFMAGATGCTTTSGSFCAVAEPLYMRGAVYDAMNDREAARMLAYLRTGERLCGWKP